MVFERITVKAILSVAFLLSWCQCASAMYDPTLGRFVSRDPIGYSKSAYLYNYASSAPNRWIDPLGWADTAPGYSECCRSCEKALNDLSTGFEQVQADGKVCPVRIRCGFTKPRSLADTVKNPNIEITMNILRSCWTLKEMQLTLAHELQHAKDFCSGRLPVGGDSCAACWATEFPAYVAECRLLFSTEEEVDQCAHLNTKRHCELVLPKCAYPTYDEVQNIFRSLSD